MMTAKQMQELRRFRPMQAVGGADPRIPKGWSIVTLMPFEERLLTIKKYPIYWSVR